MRVHKLLNQVWTKDTLPNLIIIGGVVFLLLRAISTFPLEVGLIPVISLAGMAVVSLILLFKPSPSSTKKGPYFKKPITVILIVLSSFVYIIMFEKIGFFISTNIFLLFAMVILGNRDPKQIIGILAGINLIVYLFFIKLLGLQLPTFFG